MTIDVLILHGANMMFLSDRRGRFDADVADRPDAPEETAVTAALSRLGHAFRSEMASLVRSKAMAHRDTRPGRLRDAPPGWRIFVEYAVLDHLCPPNLLTEPAPGVIDAGDLASTGPAPTPDACPDWFSTITHIAPSLVRIADRIQTLGGATSAWEGAVIVSDAAMSGASYGVLLPLDADHHANRVAEFLIEDAMTDAPSAHESLAAMRRLHLCPAQGTHPSHGLGEPVGP